ncbi:sensor domain-containing protein [Actinocrinis puniceicyclus]|uniref:histidine kinase n=1 Tax=Actinocrinis puniceicyclus TaxID=977794 RepID=A0A8J8BBK1_9ACTN|nr:sensor histidine kinase [Actinocrinis puniceicyclus]MBS2962560.1 sensor domain-containing protein [Actinocrinis puniceicyclus]
MAITGPADAVARRDPPRSRFKRALLAPWQGLVLTLVAGLNIAVVVLQVEVIAFISLGVGLLLLPISTLICRWVANLARDLAWRWQGVQIPRPYRPKPAFQRGAMGLVERCRWILRDPATWRDLGWSSVNMVLGLILAILPASLVVYGVEGFVDSFLWPVLVRHGEENWYTFVHLRPGNEHLRWVSAWIGAFVLILGFLTGPALLRAHAHWTRVLLKPTRAAELALRVRHLTETRADAVDASAAELRRIERDLHDGAQARLVAMGMNLSAAEALLEHHPDEARALLLEARDASIKALAELRGLVRGIHPPVLSDRGLADAVRALALDSALNVEVTADLPGRAQAPVESAAYFAASELLTNVAKHSGGTRAWVDLSHANGVLRLTVTDDGHGGADPGGGTGLRGVERRIGTFDGLLTVTSPPGGPTVVTLEIPCALSSPKTSSS